MMRKVLNALITFTETSKYSGMVIAMISLVLVILFTFTQAYELFELKLYDLRFQIKEPIKEWDKLVFIDIDEASINTLGEFPWTRDLYALGLDTLKELQVSQTTFDILFLDQSPLQLNVSLFDKLKQYQKKGNVIPPDMFDALEVDHDKIFIESVAHINNVILPYAFSRDQLTLETIERRKKKEFQNAYARFLEKATIKVPRGKDEYYAPLADSSKKTLSLPIPALMAEAHGFGFVDRDSDIDGVMRKIRLVRYHEGRLYFNLALAMLINTCHISMKNIAIHPGKYIILKQALHPISQKIENIIIPINQQGMIYINWAGEGPREKSFTLLPFYWLIEYFDRKEIAYDFFDYVELQVGPLQNSRLTRLYKRLTSDRKEYLAATSAPSKRKILAEIDTIHRKIAATKIEYAQILAKEIERLTKKISQNPDKDIEHTLADRQYQYDSAKLVIELENLARHTIITGLTAISAHDISTTPTSTRYPRVGIYHNTVNTIVQNSFIKRLDKISNFLMMIIIAILIGFIVQRLSARKSLLTITASFLFLNVIIIIVFKYYNIWIEQIGLSLALLFPSITISSLKFIKEESQKRFIKNAFSHYLAPTVIDQIIANPSTMELGGSERELTTFFSDIQGFSTISEKLSPTELVKLLNDYLSDMSDIILSYEGTVDKYEGDAIMAFWGAPHDLNDHALRSCYAAIDMQIRMIEKRKIWTSQGQSPLYVRMGINTGPTVVGNMGSHSRMDYTVMGDAVNLASRLEGANKYYNTFMMISSHTYELAKNEIEARELDTIQVVGKKEPIQVYEILGKKGTLSNKDQKMLQHYYEGLDLFKKRQWAKARNAFRAATKIIKNDGPSLAYIDRCKKFIRKPPSATWNGVYTLKGK